MKKITIVLAMLISFAVTAQEHDGQKEHFRKGPAGLKMKMPKKPSYTPEQMATLQTKKMVLALDLNKAQQNQLQKFNAKNIKERRARIKKLKTLKSGERKKFTADQKFKIANDRLDRAIVQKEELKRILGEEKYKKHQAMHKKRKAMVKRKMTARKKQIAIKKKKMAMRKKK